MCHVTAHTIMQLIVKNTSLTIAQLSWSGFIHRDKPYVRTESHTYSKGFSWLIWIHLISYSTVSTLHSRKVRLVKALMWLPPTSLKNNKESGFIHVLCNSFAGGTLRSGLVLFYSDFSLSIYFKNCHIFHLVLNMNVNTKYSKLYPFIWCCFVFIYGLTHQSSQQ